MNNITLDRVPARPHVWVDTDNIVHIRNSERGTLDRCPQQWWWSWRDGLRAKETAKPLWFGTAIHEALAHYYGPGKKRRKDFIDKFRESADMEAEYMRINVGGLDEDQYVEAKTLGESMLTEYVAEYGRDKDWDVIATEQSFEVSIPYVGKAGFRSPIVDHILKNYGDFFILNGTFDGVYRDKADGRVKLMEHKTAASISVGHLPMDNQAGTYWMVAQTVGRAQGWLGKSENISAITYNFLRKSLPDPRPRDDDGYCTNKPLKDHYIAVLEPLGLLPALKKDQTLSNMAAIAGAEDLTVLGDRSKTQPPLLFERHTIRKNPRMRRAQLERLQAEVLRMHSYVDGWLPLTKEPDRTTCSWCPFKEMCELHESSGGWVEFRDSMFRATDPYEDHRKSA